MSHPTFFKHDIPSRLDRKLEKDAKAAAQWRQVCKVVDHRDKRTCRACGKKTNPDAVGLLRGHRHHLQYRSAGGPSESWNLVLLCPTCHQSEHRSQLRIDGNADVMLDFWRRGEDGHWYLSRRELGVHQIEKD
jgi:hypothetical protein